MTTVDEPNGTLRFRVQQLEVEHERLRARSHDLVAEQQTLRLLVQHANDALEHLEEDVRALKRAFYTFAFGVVGSAVVFAFTVFALLGHK